MLNYSFHWDKCKNVYNAIQVFYVRSMYYVRSMFARCSLDVRSMYYVRSMFALCSLYVRSMFVRCTMFALCSLDVRSMFARCTMFALCSLDVLENRVSNVIFPNVYHFRTFVSRFSLNWNDIIWHQNDTKSCIMCHVSLILMKMSCE